MKTTLLLLLTCAFINAETVSWSKNPELTVTSYQASYGTSSGHYTYHLPKGPATSVIIPKQHLVNNTTYYFTVVAFDENGLQSVPSEEVSYRRVVVVKKKHYPDNLNLGHFPKPFLNFITNSGELLLTVIGNIFENPELL